MTWLFWIVESVVELVRFQEFEYHNNAFFLLSWLDDLQFSSEPLAKSAVSSYPYLH